MWGPGDYGLTVTYRLTTSATAAEVIEFFRANLPPGWTEASDQTCARLGAQMPAPPVATVPPGPIDAGTAPPTTGTRGPLVLMPQGGEVTVFAPDKAQDDHQRSTGVTFKVSPSRGRAERLSLNEATFACHRGDPQAAWADTPGALPLALRSIPARRDSACSLVS